MWQQKERFFKYKANEIETLLRYIIERAHSDTYGAQCMIYQKKKEKNNKEMACNKIFVPLHKCILMLKLNSNCCPFLVQSVNMRVCYFGRMGMLKICFLSFSKLTTCSGPFHFLLLCFLQRNELCKTFSVTCNCCTYDDKLVNPFCLGNCVSETVKTIWT